METQTIEYTKTYVPPSMRSPYWKYFGFPSTDSNEIVTKSKIVCSICKAVISYNKNTTNLRTHLVAKHSDIFVQINNEKSQAKDFGNDYKRLKFSQQLSTGTITIRSTQSDNDDVDEIKEANEEVEEDDESNENDENVFQMTTVANNFDVLENIQNMIITDLHPPSTVRGKGFINLISNIDGEFNERKVEQIERSIDNLYQKSFNSYYENIKKLSTSNEPFSLTIEIFTNIKNKTLMNIYFFHLINEPEITLSNLFLKCATLDECTNFNEIFNGIELKNCSAVVVNKSSDLIKDFFRNEDISIIFCLESVIINCIKNLFNLNAVQQLFNEIRVILEKHSVFTEFDTVPEVDDNFEWSKFNFLKYFCENISLSDELDYGVMEKSKQIYELMLPLKQTLEIVSEEQVPMCSLIKPLILKLIEHHYSTSTEDSEIILDMKATINKELNENIIEDSYLTEASFMDPRFQPFLNPDSIQIVKNSIIKKFNSQNASMEELSTIKIENNQSLVNTSNSRKTSLKQFFNRGSGSERSLTQLVNKNTLEFELIKYSDEINIDLEQCPVVWWKEMGYIYRQLRKISSNYFCVPCCVNNIFKQSINEQINLLSRRFLLKEKHMNQLWFLNYNKVYKE